jgi:hypothetical protein
MVTGLAFDPSTNEYAQFHVHMPDSWDTSTFTATFTWLGASAGSGSVIWEIQAVKQADANVLSSAAFGTAQSVTDAFSAANAMMETSSTSAVTPGGAGVGNRSHLIIQVYRNAAAGGDTYASDAVLLGVRIEYGTVGIDDA